MTLHRISTLLVLLFGLAQYFVIIPAQVETVSYGWVRPNTVPNALAILIVVVAAVQLINSDNPVEERPTLLHLARALAFFVGVWICAYLMPIIGFLKVALPMALILMLAVGERRWIWLVVGGVFLPTLIWYGTEIVLGRPLP